MSLLCMEPCVVSQAGGDAKKSMFDVPRQLPMRKKTVGLVFDRASSKTMPVNHSEIFLAREALLSFPLDDSLHKLYTFTSPSPSFLFTIKNVDHPRVSRE